MVENEKQRMFYVRGDLKDENFCKIALENYCC